MQREELVRAKCKDHWAVGTEEGIRSLRKRGQGKGQAVQAQCSQGSSRSLGVGSGHQGIADADTRYKKPSNFCSVVQIVSGWCEGT